MPCVDRSGHGPRCRARGLRRTWTRRAAPMGRSSTTHSEENLMRTSQTMMVLVIAGAFAAGCKDGSVTSANAPSGGAAVGDVAAPLPIASEALTQRHTFTDDVSVQVRLKPS